jgi:excisionase family DNA binding protein
MRELDKMLTVAELARRLDVGQEKVRELARDGRIPFLRVGKTMRFEWAAVRAALGDGGAVAVDRPETQP